ncbi:LysR family transcriptional regulator [Actibacterium pelagium]|uniref:LysR family transcriptional regulator n=1 Tax=Actibacterium pelagium TaxID=2029103 RepID=A0A917ALJ8_9RHOB|nr:LysR family transcriptional regulator [Actibacterium pelagium]GGE59551.1 LysR family transcriptional regulator [Actibacterium pelagium]
MINLLSLDLNLLRVLDALLELRSTTKASERLGLTQPAVSAALGRLRLSLDDPLFIREGQGIVPTDYARGLQVPLRCLLEDIASTLSKEKTFDPSRARDSFKLSGTDFFAEILMPRLADRMARQAPFMQVQLVDLVPDGHLEKLREIDVDISLNPRTTYPDWIESQTVLYSDFVVTARKDHPRLERAGITPGEVIPMDLYCDLGHVVFSPEGRLQTMGDIALQKAGRSRRVAMSLPFMSSVLSAVSSSDLVALTASQLANHLAPRLGLSLYHPPMQVPRVELCMTWHKSSSHNPAHRWFRSLVAEILETV